MLNSKAFLNEIELTHMDEYMLKLKFYIFVFCFFFACVSTDISLALDDNENEDNPVLITSDVKSFELWKTDPDARLLGLEYLKTLKNNQTELDEEVCKCIEASFSGLLYQYERLTLDREEKIDLAIKIREFEFLLSKYVNAGKVNPKDLYLEGMPELEMISLNSANIGALVAAKKIEKDIPKWVLDVISKGGSVIRNITRCMVSPRFSRLPSAFEGNTFLVGGERSAPSTNQDCYTLNFLTSMHPDILGFAENLSSLVAIPDSKFTIIEFDFLDNTILLNEEVLEEYYRILALGGTFIFKTNHNSADYYCQKTIKDERKQAQENLMKMFGGEVMQQDKKDSSWPTKQEAYYVHFQATK
jgi:hypothetical protein